MAEPLLRVDLRERDEGGGLRPHAAERWSAAGPVPQRELLVLVHGFNNDRGEAAAAYAGLRRRQHEHIGDDAAASARFERHLGDAYWPGDADWPGVVDALDFFVYPQAVATAQDAAPRIAAYLRTRADVETVHFLGHSLGCRVVLEAIDRLPPGERPTIGKVCLMAAAVPTFKVCPGGALAAALARPQAVLLLYSPDDLVLAGAFPPGQTLAAGDEGFFPEAVGHAANVPAHPGVVERLQVAGAGHGDYWGHADGAPVEQAAAAVNAFFAFDAAPRALASRPLPAARGLPAARELAAVRLVAGAD